MDQQALKVSMDSMFKWPIGAIVTHVAVMPFPEPPPYPSHGTREERRQWRATYALDPCEPKYVVTERYAQECPGGVQLFYLARIVGPGRAEDVGVATIRFHEEELRDLTPPAPPEPEEATQPGPLRPIAATGG